MIDRTMTSEEFPQWFTELLILRATDGLDVEQQKQFDQFVSDHPDRDRIEIEAEKYELTAAAIDVSMHNADTESSPSAMSAKLRQKVLDGAKQHFESVPTESRPTTKTAPKPDSGLTSREALAWIAAAVAVVLLLTGWNPFAEPARPVVDNTAVKQQPLSTQPLSIEVLFSNFANSEPEKLTRIDWSATGSDSAATGEVVWSDALQRGFMVFAGLQPNDPLQSQYQLWIFDTDPAQEHPVDGGVFDITSSEKTIVPIDARIPVAEAVMFAITEEKPGGVVVSDRERLPLLAE